jgi:hypothetical protein
MFNVVGYLNYRYFFLFLGYVLLACVYGLGLTAVPFVNQVATSPRNLPLATNFSVNAASQGNAVEKFCF